MCRKSRDLESIYMLLEIYNIIKNCIKLSKKFNLFDKKF